LCGSAAILEVGGCGSPRILEIECTNIESGKLLYGTDFGGVAYHGFWIAERARGKEVSRGAGVGGCSFVEWLRFVA
jgi:hypothetical protein